MKQIKFIIYVALSLLTSLLYLIFVCVLFIYFPILFILGIFSKDLAESFSEFIYDVISKPIDSWSGMLNFFDDSEINAIKSKKANTHSQKNK